MLVSKLPAFENKKYTSYDHFHGNGPYGKIPTKKEPIRTPGFTPRLPCHIIMVLNFAGTLFPEFSETAHMYFAGFIFANLIGKYVKKGVKRYQLHFSFQMSF